MLQFHFPTADLTAEHKRSTVRDVRLQVGFPDAVMPEVTGELALELVNQENRLRLGQIVELKLTGVEGRFTRIQAVLMELIGIAAPAAKQRVYQWAFLVPVRPEHDPLGLFRRAGEAAPEPAWHGAWEAAKALAARPATLAADPAAREISLTELLAEVGAQPDVDPKRFTSEGGILKGRSG